MLVSLVARLNNGRAAALLRDYRIIRRAGAIV